MTAPSRPARRWWPWLLLALLPLLAYLLWFRPRSAEAPAEAAREAQSLADTPSPFGAAFAARGHGAVV
ncbi:MAG: hypothetical protein M3Y54_03815, partial [Bacteroidota bacterium]|nr:hypothetical protein [Bacteroidota bacterium]